MSSVRKARGANGMPTWGSVNGGMTRSACGTLTASSAPDATILCFHAGSIDISVVARNRVPRQTPSAPSASAAAIPRPSAIPPAATTGTAPATSTTAGTSTIVDTHPAFPPASDPCAMTTSAPAWIAAAAASTSPTVCIQTMPRAWAAAIRSVGTPMWNEIAAGPDASVASNASGLNGRPVWLIANGRSVSPRSRRHCSPISSTDRTAVPTLPSPPAAHTAAARSTSSHGPNGASTIGTSMSSRSHNRERIKLH